MMRCGFSSGNGGLRHLVQGGKGDGSGAKIWLLTSRNLFSSGGGRSDKHGWGSDFADIIEVQIDLGPVDFGPE